METRKKESPKNPEDQKKKTANSQHRLSMFDPTEARPFWMPDFNDEGPCDLSMFDSTEPRTFGLK